MTEIELAKKIGDGDADSAEAFVREHHPAVLRLAFRLTGQIQDAEDITQETFLVARQKISSYRGNSTLRTWIHKIAINQYRQFKRKYQFVPLTDTNLPSHSADFEMFETGHILSKAIQKLPAKQREAFILFEVEQLSMNEVAHVLSVPVGTAKARVFYARRNLRNQLVGRPEVNNDEIKHSTSS